MEVETPIYECVAITPKTPNLWPTANFVAVHGPDYQPSPMPFHVREVTLSGPWPDGTFVAGKRYVLNIKEAE